MSEGSKIERLMDLLALLLHKERPVPVSYIRERIPGYEDDESEAFHRKFERDKAELRDIGFTVELSESLLGEHGYLIAKGESLLSDPGLTADEMAALALAAQAWGGTGRDGALGVLKLSIGSGEPGAGPVGWLAPRIDVDKRVGALMDAIRRRTAVRFTYRSGRTVDPVQRRVEPYRLSHRGDWYLTGFDRDRAALRHFKVSRMTGPVTVETGSGAAFDPPQAPDAPVGAPWEAEPTMEARARFAPEVVWWAERRTGAARVGEGNDGWVELALPFGDIASFASWLAGFGDRVVVAAPVELRDAVVQTLRAVAGEG